MTPWTREAVLSALKAGPFVHHRIVIETLDFESLKRVRNPFVCTECQLTGPLLGDDVVFERTFDLSGTQILGDTHLARATFEGPAVFGSPVGRQTVFGGVADFSLTAFGEIASFERATFLRSVDFTLARFGADAVYASGRAIGPATFDRASFSGISDFRFADFQSASQFRGAEFGRVAEFSDTKFRGRAGFDRARFAAGGTFFAAQFRSVVRNDFSVQFQRATSAGTLDFSSAVFAGRTGFRGVTAPGLSFSDAEFQAANEAVFTEISTPDLVMSVATIRSAIQPTNERHVLALVEASAKSRNDLAVANEAAYDRRILTSNGYWLPWRVLDRAFYGGVAGYFVRPLHPLIALVLLLAIVALARTVHDQRKPRRESPLVVVSRGRDGPRGSARWSPSVIRTKSHQFVVQFFDALGRVGRGSGRAPTPLTSRLEVFAYRVLIVCIVLGLANSNPTLRQMFDALI